MSTVFNPAFDTCVGTLRCNLPCPYSNNNNGAVLGFLDFNAVPGTTTAQKYLSLDTTNQEASLLCNIPKGTTDFTLSFVDITESALINTQIPDYEIVLYFHLVPDKTYDNNFKHFA